jgi:hypothetical protein
MAYRRASGSFACGVALVLAIGVAAAPSSAAAQERGSLRDSSPKDRPMLLSFFTGIPYGYYAAYGFPFSIGGRFLLPIVPNGFLPSVNDEFALEFGMDFNFTFLDSDVYRDSLAVSIGVPAEALWDFHFSQMFDAYAKLGFVIGGDFSRHTHDGFWASPISVVGMRLWFANAICFRAEVGYPWIKAGLGFAF